MNHRTQHRPWAVLICAAAFSASAVAAPSFVEATTSAGFTHRGESYGASWGDYNGDGLPDIFANNHRDKVSIYRNNGNGTFTDVISTVDGSGLWAQQPQQDTHGGTWADFDNDGDQDLYVTTGGKFDGRMLVNEGGILFDRARDLGVAEDVEGRLPLWLDFDRDGDLDLALMIRSASRLYRQNSPTRFTNATATAGFDCRGMDFGQLSDLNGDGVLDLICGDGSYPKKVYDISTFPFTDITNQVRKTARGIDSAIADFDNDLDPDMFVIRGIREPSGAALVTSTRLEASLGAPKNSEKGISFDTSGVLSLRIHLKNNLRNARNVHIGADGLDAPPNSAIRTGFAFSLDPADPDTHGIEPRDPTIDTGVFIGFDPGLQRWQIFSSGLADHAAGAYLEISSTQPISNLQLLNPVRGDEPDRPFFMVNTPSGFVEQGSSRGLGQEVLCVNVTSGDFDNDMDVDVYAVCRGAVQNLPNRLYENIGNGRFQLAAAHGAEGVQGFHLADKAGLGDSAITADYNTDGCLDLFVTNGLPLHPGRHDSGPDQLFRNRCNYGRQWVELDLQGLGNGDSNRDGIGARVFLTAGGVTQVREQNGGYHRWSQNHQRLHFGLAGNTVIDEIRIEWPSGRTDVFNGVQASRLYLAREGAQALQVRNLEPGDPPPPPPPADGDECGAPSIDKSSERGLFLWRDCPSGTWHLRATAADPQLALYEGSMTVDEPFPSAPVPFSLESNDVLDSSGPQARLFSLRVRDAAWDGFAQEVAAGAVGCLEVASLPAGATVYLGRNKRQLGTSVDLRTLGPCN